LGPAVLGRSLIEQLMVNASLPLKEIIQSLNQSQHANDSLGPML